jgi:histidinol-phosphate/aromatic aminotransferase/cobyric acid decarboxylase-like protein
MKYPVDLSIFHRAAHNPSYFSLMRSLPPKASVVDFCIPCNPYFPTKEMFQDWASRLEMILKFYPSDNESIAHELGNLLGLDPRTLVLANGSTELISWIDALFIKENILTPIPTFGRWTDQPLESGKELHVFPVHAEEGFAFNLDAFIQKTFEVKAKVVAVCNPNNPTGILLTKAEIRKMVEALHSLDLIIIDESFIDFSDSPSNPSFAEEASKYGNVIVLKSLGKNFGLHGVRFGYTVSNKDLAEKLRVAVPRWNINSLAENIIFSLKHHQEEYYESLRKLKLDRKYLEDKLHEIAGLTIFPSQGNFVLFRLPEGVNGEECRNHLLTEHALFVRECGNKMGVDSSFIRIVVRPKEEVDLLVEGLSDFLAISEPKRQVM